MIWNMTNHLGLPPYTNHHPWSVKQPLLIWFIRMLSWQLIK